MLQRQHAVVLRRPAACRDARSRLPSLVTVERGLLALEKLVLHAAVGALHRLAWGGFGCSNLDCSEGDHNQGRYEETIRIIPSSRTDIEVAALHGDSFHQQCNAFAERPYVIHARIKFNIKPPWARHNDANRHTNRVRCMVMLLVFYFP